MSDDSNPGGGRHLIYFLVYCGSLILPLFVIAYVAVQLLYRWNVQPRLVEARSQQAEYLQAYLDDLDFLARFDLLRPSVEKVAAGLSQPDDAGRILNTKFAWVTLPPEVKFSRSWTPPPLISAADRNEIIRLQGDWLEKAFRATRMKVDLGFFDELAKFSHWDLEAGSPLADLTAGRLFISPSALPIPDVSELLVAVKIRLMLGAVAGAASLRAPVPVAKPGQPQPIPETLRSLRDVRHLARLLMTTENLQLLLTGLAILDVERFAYRYYVDNGLLPAEAWTPIDRNVSRRAHRAVKATREYLFTWTDESIINQVYLQRAAFPPGFCAAVNEALPSEERWRKLLKPQLPLEMDLRENFARLEAVYKKGKDFCRWKYLGTLMKTGDINENFGNEIPSPLILSRAPYSRKIFGLRLSVMEFGGFEGYR